MREKILNFLLQIGVSQKSLEKLYIFVYQKWKRAKTPSFILDNKLQFKKKKISALEYSLKNILLNSKQDFGDNTFYQSYPPLDISGERDTSFRYNSYGLSEYLNNNTEVLDVGGNTGFFSLYISKQVFRIDVVEYDECLVKIGEILTETEKIANVDFFCESFLNFVPTKKYDFIMSCAVHKWIGLDFREYLLLLHGYLNTEGLILLESQNLEIDPFDENILKISDLFTTIKYCEINEPGLYKRKFVILKKI